MRNQRHQRRRECIDECGTYSLCVVDDDIKHPLRVELEQLGFNEEIACVFQLQGALQELLCGAVRMHCRGQ